MEKSLQTIDDSKKIKNILDILNRTNAIFIMRNLLLEYRGRIKEIASDNFTFISDVPITNVEDQINLSFFYLNKYHYLTTTPIHVDDKEIVLKMPRQIYIHIKRKFKRYNAENEYMTCNLKVINYNSDIQTNLEIKKNSGAMRNIYNELNSDKPDFSKIVTMIREDNKNICDDFKIFTSIEKMPDQNAAAFLNNFKKPLLLNNLLEMKYDPYTGAYKTATDFYMIKDYIDFLARRTNSDNAKNILVEMAANYKRNSIYSLLYVPIIVLSKVIGVIRIVNTVTSKRVFSLSDVDYFILIAKIINESIIKNKLNSIDDNSLKIKIKDISLTGIGIEIEDNIFSTFLKKNTVLKVFIDQNDNPWINFIGYIKRLIPKKDMVRIGIEISEILPNNHTKLVNLIKNYMEKKSS